MTPNSQLVIIGNYVLLATAASLASAVDNHKVISNTMVMVIHYLWWAPRSRLQQYDDITDHNVQFTSGSGAPEPRCEYRESGVGTLES